MKYRDGGEVSVGDRVRLWRGCEGVVVCSIDSGRYSDGYSKEDWAYLGKGVLVLSDKAGLIHFDVPDEDFERLP